LKNNIGITERESSDTDKNRKLNELSRPSAKLITAGGFCFYGMKEISINDIVSYKVKNNNRGYGKGGFYMIECSINGMRYIGKSIDYMSRLKQHTYPSQRKTAIDRAINEYGIGSFKFYLLAEYSEFNINFYTRSLETVIENRLIGRFRTVSPYGYNIVHYGHL